MKRVLLIGGGGHCLSCIATIETEKGYEIRGIIDGAATGAPGRKADQSTAGYPVLGADDRLAEFVEDSELALVAVGFVDSCETRVRLFERLAAFHRDELLEPIIARNASVARSSRVGQGSIIMQYALVNAEAEIGDNCIINNRALIEHGAKVGDHSHISTGAIVNGDCEIGLRVFVGSGAVLKHGIRIAADARIGAGAIVVRDIERPGWYAGNPARLLRN